jgi:hypothetical protein
LYATSPNRINALAVGTPLTLPANVGSVECLAVDDTFWQCRYHTNAVVHNILNDNAHNIVGCIWTSKFINERICGIIKKTLESRQAKHPKAVI